jgi:hypothetical protein
MTYNALLIVGVAAALYATVGSSRASARTYSPALIKHCSTVEPHASPVRLAIMR